MKVFSAVVLTLLFASGAAAVEFEPHRRLP